MEYLKNVGIRTVKPDTHIMRICGQDRLGLFSTGADEDTAQEISQKVSEALMTSQKDKLSPESASVASPLRI